MPNLQEKANALGIEVTITSIEIRPKRKELVIMGVYRPPNSKVSWFNAFNELLIEARQSGQICILGDLNSNLLKPTIYPGSALINTLELAGTQINSTELKPTRVTSNTATCLDIISIDKELLCTEYNNLDSAISDHFPVSAAILIHATPLNKPVIKRSFNCQSGLRGTR